MKLTEIVGIHAGGHDSYQHMKTIVKQMQRVLMLGLFSLLSAASQAGEVKVGEVAPDFELKNQDGKVVKLSDYKGKKKVVLVFSRGHW